MAVIYLRSADGSDVSDGLTWADAKATLAAALTAAGSGGTVYVADAHAETGTGNNTMTSPGTADAPVVVLCVDDTGDPEPPTALATTATVTTTSTGLIQIRGFAYFYGITFTAGSGSGSSTPQIEIAANATATWLRFEQCTFSVATTGSGARLIAGSFSLSTTDDSRIEFIDCGAIFASTSQGLRPGGFVSFHGGSMAASGSVPTTLILPAADGFSYTEFTGVNLAACSGNLVGVGTAGTSGIVRFLNCKLHASAVVTTGTHVGQGGLTVDLINGDSADTNYRYCLKNYQGEITHETTIVRTSGASDGATSFSRKFVTSANSKFYSPLAGPWSKFWNDTTGSPITVAIETVTDNVTLTNAEAWVEVLHSGTSGFPLGVFEHDRASNILSTPANQTSSSETWTTTGLTTPVKQVMSEDVTPAEKGWIYARLVVAKASTTVYACPKIKSDSADQYMDADGSIVNAPAEAAGGGGGAKVIGAGF